MINNLSKIVLEHGGQLSKLLIPSQFTETTGLCNPSILVDNGRYYVNIRNVQYTLYHSEYEQKFQNHWGCLAYLNPENDLTLRTTNFLCEIDPKSLEVIDFKKVNTSQLDKAPLWQFVGLEDARLTKWHGAFQLNGVRRDTTTNGEGRLEVSQLDENYNEVRRSRIQPPVQSYCEKNYMPILDMPYHYIKWSNPTEIIIADLSSETSKTKVLMNQQVEFPRDIRGGSQVIRYKDFYVAITHEVDLWNNEKGNKDAQYYHRFIVWDLGWNIVHHSEEFKFFDARIEFCCGLAYDKKSFIMTFGFQDSTAFVLKMPETLFEDICNITSNTSKQKRTTFSQLTTFALDTTNSGYNMTLANSYYDQKQYSSALSFYLRCAELSKWKTEVYESLLMVYKCLNNQGNRQSSEKSTLNNAIALMPDQPHAYFYMSLYYESKNEWHDAYSMSCLALSKLNKYNQRINSEISLKLYQPIFQKAVCSWQVGKFKDARELFQLIKVRYEDEMNEMYLNLLYKNITSIGGFTDPFLPYTIDRLADFRFWFSGVDVIEKNYSQTYQDMFVLSVLKNQSSGATGTYLEIGSADPIYGSNTKLLEEFSWTGHSIEIIPEMVDKFNENRVNKCHLLDATKVDYKKFIFDNYSNPTCIDYLQLDCEPPTTTFQILKNIPFDSVDFKVITFEHDHYADKTGLIRDKSREFLRSKGYELLVSNVSPNEFFAYEDWWVNPDYVSGDIIELMIADDDSVKQIDKYFLK
jgi:tetratricopeptide (TPR) repeat protein